MSREINKQMSVGKGIKWPCRHPDTGQWCWCTKNSRTCRARGIKYRDFSGFAGDNRRRVIMADDNKTMVEYSNFLGTGVSTFKIIWWSLGALVVLAVVGKGVKVYKEIKN